MSWRVFFLILPCFVLGNAEFSFAGQPCDEFLVESRDETEGLIAYLKDLLDHRVIGPTELNRLVSGLERGVLENPITKEQAVLSKYLTHREGIQGHLQQGSLDLKVLLSWARKTVQIEERAQKNQDEIRDDTRNPSQKMEFHEIQPGTFEMGEKYSAHPVTLTHPIAVMSTLLTQKHWAEVMGENPSHFKNGADSVILNINGKSIQLQPDHPVESMTWWSVIEYANRLSIQHGLKPAYDLSDLTLKEGTRAEDGTLDYEGELKINSDSGDIYETEGYRLPTEAEQEYLLRAGGVATGHYPFPDTELHKYAWYQGNADGMTHAVALLNPVMIQGKAFYDLQGNVWEWGYDWHEDYLQSPEINPQQLKVGSFRVVRGSSWNYSAVYVRSALRYGCRPQYRYEGVGVRFVRTLR